MSKQLLIWAVYQPRYSIHVEKTIYTFDILHYGLKLEASTIYIVKATLVRLQTKVSSHLVPVLGIIPLHETCYTKSWVSAKRPLNVSAPFRV